MDWRRGITGVERAVSLSRLRPSQFLTVGFALIILIGSFFLMLPIATVSGEGMGFVDALFTATSAVTVTGLIVADTGTFFTLFGQLVILVLIQTGGLGITMVATLVMLILGRRITLRERIRIQESLNQFTMQGLVRLSRYILAVTFLVEGIGAMLLSVRFVPQMGWGQGIYYSIFHAVSAFNNAGFDLMAALGSTSLEAYVGDPLVNSVMAALIVIGGIGFTVIADLWRQARGEQRRLSLHTKLALSLTGALIAAGTAMVLLFEWGNPRTLGALGLGDKVLAAFFQAIVPRTAGFNTLPVDGFRFTTLFLFMFLMFVGASPTGTGGGIKTTTFGVLALRVADTARGREDVSLMKRRVPRRLVEKALAVTMLSGAMIVIVTMTLTVTEGQRFSFLQILFESVSAFGTAGLSTGITGNLSQAGRVVLVVMMFAGRVGPLTLTSAFARREQQESYAYPEERIQIG